ncbi:hypothetical protein A2572_00235 [Candidatus Collierbacteria bacterium RIFOXYD1_FULL_40_9]|uniref:Phosphoglycerate mutase n=1 Tax=Candidatus Collierbacteria bacterium RIFOXYD1_FULL_40_9 TaxID=1817731 RepID=A0A1F5FV45_9BACT|nr:MAG: hypothetical protein A2572_00235 [Candidatus Collierbacteria bacterium RIFOXYD1_FULL_40_9]
MSTIYLVRHFSTGFDNNNPKKQYQSKNLSKNGRADGQIAVRYFADKGIKRIITSEFTRANESGHLAQKHLAKKGNLLEVETSSLLNEWWIPNIWGEKHKDLHSYFAWRKTVFEELQVRSIFDSDSESLWNLYQIRVPKVLDLLRGGQENKLIFTHSQLIATTISYVENGPKISAERLVESFGNFFPKICGAVAEIHCDDYTKKLTLIDHNYIKHIPK